MPPFSSSPDSTAGLQSLSFDRAASLYDATRGYSPEVEEQIGAALLDAANAQPDTRFLEVGVGTGRIALPIARQGYDYTGVDISEEMMARLREKAEAIQQSAGADAPPLRLQLLMADMTALPFADAAFDAAVAVHVFHLVRAWQQAVDEVLRVLRPGGVFLHCWDEYIGTAEHPLQERWVECVREVGGEVGILGVPRRSQVGDYLRERGLTVETLRTVIWTTQASPKDEFDYIARRTWSRTWLVSDDLFSASIRRLESWAMQHYGTRYAVPQSYSHQFVISQARK